MNASDFFYQATEPNNNEFYVSLARNEVVDKYIDMFTCNNCLVASVNLAPLVNDILGQISKDYTHISLPNAQLNFKNGFIVDYSKASNSEETYVFSEEKVSSEVLSLFSAGLHFFTNYGIGGNPQTKLLQFREELGYYLLKKWVGLFSLFTIFALLLINFLLFNNYSQKYSQTAAQVEQYANLINFKDSLASNINKKKQCIADLGLTKASRYSYYTDRLIIIKPDEIRLLKLEIDPAIVNESDGTISFTKNSIKITGNTNGSIKINQWINEIKKLDWVKAVNLQNYKKDSAEELASFNIEIIINS